MLLSQRARKMETDVELNGGCLQTFPVNHMTIYRKLLKEIYDKNKMKCC